MLNKEMPEKCDPNDIGFRYTNVYREDIALNNILHKGDELCVLSVRVPKSVLWKLDQAARSLGVSRSMIVNFVLANTSHFVFCGEEI